MLTTALLTTALLLGQTQGQTQAPQVALPFPTGETQTINIIQWDSNQLPKVYERSDQLPLTDEEVAKLAQGRLRHRHSW